MKSSVRYMVFGGIALATGALLIAQPSEDTVQRVEVKPEYGTMYLDCKLGSFKSIDGEGRLQVSFEGTLLVSRLEDGDVQILSGSLRKEYEGHDRVCYTGKGTVVINGKWRGIQWLGANMNAVWNGHGIMRITGEFWENPATGQLETGRYWYKDPEEWQPFPSAGVANVTNPEMVYGVDTSVTPRVRQPGE